MASKCEYLASETEWERYGPALGWLHFAFFMMALEFGLDVLNGGSPMTPDSYGHRVYSIPALVWVFTQMVPAGLGVIGAVIGGYKGAALCAVTSALLAILFGVFSVLAAYAPDGAVMRAGGRWVGLMLFVVSFTFAAKHVLRRARQ